MPTKSVLLAFLAVLLVVPDAMGQPEKETAYPAKVSPNGRFLLDQRGGPFFYLGDTARELFHRLSLDDAEVYLRDRASKGFTVIQAVVLAEHGGLDVPNARGELPLVNKDPTR